MATNPTIQGVLPRDAQAYLSYFLDIPDLCRFGAVSRLWRDIAMHDARWSEIARQIQCPVVQGGQPRQIVISFIQMVYNEGKQLGDARIRDILAATKTTEKVVRLLTYFKAIDILLFAEGLKDSIKFLGPRSINLTIPNLENLTSHDAVIEAAKQFRLDLASCSDQISIAAIAISLSGQKIKRIPKELFEISQLKNLLPIHL